MKKKFKIAIMGLGYVGLPLAAEFGKIYQTIGYDINSKKISLLKKNNDIPDIITNNELRRSKKLTFTNNIIELNDCNFFIVTVPTPIDKKNNPDMRMMISATKSIAKLLKKNDIVIFESTVYPGASEEMAYDYLEKISGLKLNKDFYLGYSPERINPGDKSRDIKKIKKVTSGSNKYAANVIDSLYKKIITAGTYKASSIQVAEASKIIENSQRDLNIGLINEFSIILEKMGINTRDVLDAAETKWNFLPFKPGLVGGHCISVDPYYLAHIAKKNKIDHKLILAARSTNENMSVFIANKIKKELINKSMGLSRSKILILGFSFKENCTDIRNTKVFDLYKCLKKFSSNVYIYDSVVDHNEVKSTYKINLLKKLKYSFFDVIIHAVPHKKFLKINNNIELYKKDKSIVFDIKYGLKKYQSDFSL